MSTPAPPATAALTDADLQRLDDLLDAVPPPLQALDVSALDGYLCGVLLQPQRLPESRWLPLVTDLEGHAASQGAAAGSVTADAATVELQALVRRRHAELDHAIGRRDWFDPWIYQLHDLDDNAAPPADCVLPWVAGFAAAMEAFPALMALGDADLVEPLALLFMHFDPADLEDADALLEVIETLEPPAELGEAVQDLVRALMLIADVTRPRAVPRREPARRGQPTRKPRR